MNIKLLNLKSKLLTDFYHVPTYIEAAVILPPSYMTETDRKYPVVFVLPGWGSTHASATRSDFQQKRYGMTGIGEEKIYILLNQDSRYGCHVFADSDNNGPRETSFIQELIPHVEKQYRVVKSPQARFLVGQSSGAWAALWLLINHPDQFGMAWVGSPDPVDFRDFVGVNLYEEDANVFYDRSGNLRPAIRNGRTEFTIKDWCDMEAAMGESGQYQSFEAVFGGKGKDGAPQQMFNRATSRVDPQVVKSWRNYDLNLLVNKLDTTSRNELTGKIHIVVADNDDFYLDGAVKLFQKTLQELHLEANIRLFQEGEHNVWSDQIRLEMHQTIDKIAPQRR